MSHDLESKPSVSNLGTVTVAEIRAKIKDLPDDMPVFISGSALQGGIWMHLVEPIMRLKVKRQKDHKVAQRGCKETAEAKECLVIY